MVTNNNTNNTHEMSHPRPISAPTLPTEPYLVLVSRRFILLTLLSAILLAFALGQILRFVVLDTPRRVHWIEPPPSPPQPQQNSLATTTTSISSKATTTTTTPPHTIYTFKQQLQQTLDTTTAINGNDDDDDDDDDDGSLNGLHLLFDMEHVDSSFLQSEEQLVEAMKQLVTQSSLTLLSYTCQGLEPSPFGGINCVGVLLEFGHVSFYTWPSDGVMTLDLFFSSSSSTTNGSKQKVSMVSVIALAEELLARPSLSSSSTSNSSSSSSQPKQQPPTFQWARKYRGFKEHRSGGVDDADLDTFAYLGSRVDYKQQVSVVYFFSLFFGSSSQWRLPSSFSIVNSLSHKFSLTLHEQTNIHTHTHTHNLKIQIASVQTWLQRVSIHDLIRPGIQSKASYDKSLSSTTDGSSSYESQNPTLFLPDRLVFLDGVLQSRRSGDAPYHETLVHPAMFAHSHPKRVAIIGGGEAATLREVLKHNTVEQVVMVEIDKVMVETSSKFLPEWSDCSNLVGSSTKSCLDDPRATFYFEDALAWFIDRFSATNQKIQGELPFDVIIMDALYVYITMYTWVVLAELTFWYHPHERKKKKKGRCLPHCRTPLDSHTPSIVFCVSVAYFFFLFLITYMYTHMFYNTIATHKFMKIPKVESLPKHCIMDKISYNHCLVPLPKMVCWWHNSDRHPIMNKRRKTIPPINSVSSLSNRWVNLDLKVCKTLTM
jgi:S-adenosylmethionine/arginine decarboxylase-like enzyme